MAMLEPLQSKYITKIPTHQYIKHPVNKLYSLEIRSNEPITKDELKLIPENIPTESNNDECDDTFSQPTHIAADNGVLIRRLYGQI